RIGFESSTFGNDSILGNYGLGISGTNVSKRRRAPTKTMLLVINDIVMSKNDSKKKGNRWEAMVKKARS
ncbi:hypothetical protein Gogos_002371, partial [Gossypium gossypioides]|nr:hypothetical protein [Gossypium gossypioides]